MSFSVKLQHPPKLTILFSREVTLKNHRFGYLKNVFLPYRWPRKMRCLCRKRVLSFHCCPPPNFDLSRLPASCRLGGAAGRASSVSAPADARCHCCWRPVGLLREFHPLLFPVTLQLSDGVNVLGRHQHLSCRCRLSPQHQPAVIPIGSLLALHYAFP